MITKLTDGLQLRSVFAYLAMIIIIYISHFHRSKLRASELVELEFSNIIWSF